MEGEKNIHVAAAITFKDFEDVEVPLSEIQHGIVLRRGFDHNK